MLVQPIHPPVLVLLPCRTAEVVGGDGAEPAGEHHAVSGSARAVANLKVLLDTDDLEFASGNVRHKKQTSGLEQIVIWQDGDKNLHVKVKKNGVWSPEGTELDMTFNNSWHTTDGWWD